MSSSQEVQLAAWLESRKLDIDTSEKDTQSIERLVVHAVDSIRNLRPQSEPRDFNGFYARVLAPDAAAAGKSAFPLHIPLAAAAAAAAASAAAAAGGGGGGSGDGKALPPAPPLIQVAAAAAAAAAAGVEASPFFNAAENKLMEWTRRVDGRLRRFTLSLSNSATTAVKGSTLNDMQVRMTIAAHGGRLRADFSNLEDVYFLYMPPHIHASLQKCHEIAQRNPNFRTLNMYQFLFGWKNHSAVYHFTDFVCAQCNYDRVLSGARARDRDTKPIVIATYRRLLNFFTVGPC